LQQRVPVIVLAHVKYIRTTVLAGSLKHLRRMRLSA
jgi:hypothetical protein